MRVFVAGATGVIGRRVVPRLLADGHQVTAVARSSEQRARLAARGASAIDLDLFAVDAVRQAVAGHDAVVNLATHMPPSMFKMMFLRSWRENDHVRREGSAILVDAALRGGAERFLQESFAPVYPDAGDEWIHERVALQPVRYNASILDAERSAERFTSNGRIGIVLRFAAFYGPDALQTQDMARAVRHGLAPIPGPPEAFLSSVSHDDAASAVVAALGAPAGAYNVADDEPLRHREFADAIAEACGVAPPRLPPAWVAKVSGVIGELLSRSVRISNAKLRAAARWAPRYPSAREGWMDVVAEMREAA